MKTAELKRKARENEGMTVKEIKAYEKLVKPKVHVYGKYGTLAKKYLQEYNIVKYMALAGDLPEYLHGIDEQADEMYKVMYEKLSKSEQFQKTGVFLHDLRVEEEIKRRIEEEILSQLVYVS
ncbi:MAG: TnpV protein [Clostridia bacterium]|nr:TnpV protein [Clostridia bacterium]